MSEENKVRSSGDQKIPDELIQKLDEANAKFHEDKEHLERELDSFEPEREHRVARRREELRKTEERMEDISSRIEKTLDPRKTDE